MSISVEPGKRGTKFIHDSGTQMLMRDDARVASEFTYRDFGILVPYDHSIAPFMDLVPAFARSIDELELPPRKEGAQYLEVGTGLSESIEYFVQIPGPKPIVVDMMDYVVARELLAYALDSGFAKSSECQEHIQKLINRVDTIKDPDQVRLINENVLDILDNNPELENTIDFLYDNHGAIVHSREEVTVRNISLPTIYNKLVRGSLDQALFPKVARERLDYYHSA